MDIRFADHSSFQRAAAGMVGGALLFAAALHPVTPLAPLAGGILGIAAGAAIGHGRAVWRIAMAATALVPLVLSASHWPLLAVAAALVALAVAAGGPRGLRGLLGALLGATVVLVAMWCAVRIGHAQKTSQWPPLVTTAIAAAAMGIVGALALLPRHVHAALDPVRAAVKRLPTALDAEISGLCNRAVAIWGTAQDRIADDAGRALVRDGVLKMLEVAARSAEVKRTGPSEAEIAQRIADLDQRIAAATDGEVRAQYQAARAAVGDQQRHCEHLKQGRERLVARMHNHVAALEKFSLHWSPPATRSALRPAIATRRGARDSFGEGPEAARAASAGAAAVKQLEELSHDIAASGEALAELEIGELPTASSQNRAQA